ncbi:MAG TPA: hypothetical protein VGH79_10655 [Gaiellaceae bacterium]
MLQGIAAGASGGGAVGSLFRKGLRLNTEMRARVAVQLIPGGAAVMVVVPARHAAAVAERLRTSGGSAYDAGAAPSPEPTHVAEPVLAPG